LYGASACNCMNKTKPHVEVSLPLHSAVRTRTCEEGAGLGTPARFGMFTPGNPISTPHPETKQSLVPFFPANPPSLPHTSMRGACCRQRGIISGPLPSTTGRPPTLSGILTESNRAEAVQTCHGHERTQQADKTEEAQFRL
jgi:hypothetical protein